MLSLILGAALPAGAAASQPRIVEPRCGVEALALAPDQAARLRALATRGGTVLFSGPAGSGKLDAAAAVAAGRDTVVHRVDASRIVGKYIGETEKNLERLFKAAAESGAVLLFDEADALFGKRSEVKDSHDRYANVEVSYLLQRLEDFPGIVILASNRRDDLYPALVRRIRLVVEFPSPDSGRCRN